MGTEGEKASGTVFEVVRVVDRMVRGLVQIGEKQYLTPFRLLGNREAPARWERPRSAAADSMSARRLLFASIQRRQSGRTPLALRPPVRLSSTNRVRSAPSCGGAKAVRNSLLHLGEERVNWKASQSERLV